MKTSERTDILMKTVTKAKDVEILIVGHTIFIENL